MKRRMLGYMTANKQALCPDTGYYCSFSGLAGEKSSLGIQLKNGDIAPLITLMASIVAFSALSFEL